MNANKLYVIGAYTNPRRTQVRPRLCRKWVQDTLDSGVNVTLVQHVEGDRPYEFSKDDPLFKHVNLISLRGGPQHEIWLQHALYNHGIARQPDCAEYVNTQDTDIKHLKKDWAYDTVHMLQLYKLGQTWTHSIDLDPNGNIARNEWKNDVDRSFCAAWLANEVNIQDGPYCPQLSKALLPKKDRDWRAHTGYSWAYRKDIFIGKGGRRGIGKLLDWMIIGSGDYHMAHAFAGNLRAIVHKTRTEEGNARYCEAYFRKLEEFADLCTEVIEQDIGCVDGTLEHGWHGSKKLRFYGAREEIIRESGFNPDRDIAYDFNGLPYLCSKNLVLRDGIRRYNMLRQEDSIDLY